ncbi:MAG: hypothetical protein VW683_08335 [Betaproteobacteria bacterium]
MYKVGDLVRFPGRFEGSLDEGYPMGVVIKAISSPRDDEYSAEVKWVMGPVDPLRPTRPGRPGLGSEPVAHLMSFFIRDGNMEIISRVDVR